MHAQPGCSRRPPVCFVGGCASSPVVAPGRSHRRWRSRGRPGIGCLGATGCRWRRCNPRSPGGSAAGQWCSRRSRWAVPRRPPAGGGRGRGSCEGEVVVPIMQVYAGTVLMHGLVSAAAARAQPICILGRTPAPAVSSLPRLGYRLTSSAPYGPYWHPMASGVCFVG